VCRLGAATFYNKKNNKVKKSSWWADLVPQPCTVIEKIKNKNFKKTIVK
jgi:hypothetical protein